MPPDPSCTEKPCAKKVSPTSFWPLNLGPAGSAGEAIAKRWAANRKEALRRLPDGAAKTTTSPSLRMLLLLLWKETGQRKPCNAWNFRHHAPAKTCPANVHLLRGMSQPAELLQPAVTLASPTRQQMFRSHLVGGHGLSSCSCCGWCASSSERRSSYHNLIACLDSCLSGQPSVMTLVQLSAMPLVQ